MCIQFLTYKMAVECQLNTYVHKCIFRYTQTEIENMAKTLF